jgi:hypothetical protein
VLLTCSLSALLAGAISEIRSARRTDGRIELRCGDREDCVLVELEHNGALSSSELRAAAFGQPFGSSRSAPGSACDLASVREHLRQVGAELLVDSSEERTLIRLFLPTSRAFAPELPAGHRNRKNVSRRS